MNNKEIHELIEKLSDSNIAEFKMEKKDFSIRIRTNEYCKNTGSQIVSVAPNAMQAPPQHSVTQHSNIAATAPSNTATTDKEESKEPTNNSSYVEFKSPMVGTFYRKPSPDKDVFVKVGDKIKKGDVVCIIEAMKLFNEVESEISGTIIKVLVDDQTPVEYDQALFLIDPS